MSVHPFSSRDLARDVGAAKRAAVTGPVFITDRGRPAFVLIKTHDDYRLAGQQTQSLLEVMDAIPGGFTDGRTIKFGPPRLTIEFPAAELG